MSKMWFTFIVAVQFACALCSAEFKDNQNIEKLATQEVDNRIFSGSATRIKNLPYQVYIRAGYRDKDGMTFILKCGGGILHPKIIITAAHCVSEERERKIEVRAGSSFKDHDGVTIDVSQVIVHQSFTKEFSKNGQLRRVDFDVALLKLSKSLKYSKYIQNVKIPKKDDHLSPGEYGTVAGWGFTFGTTPTDVLQKTQLPVMSDEECHPHSSFEMNPRLFCAGYNKKDKSTICFGDSGGPFVKNNKIYGVACATFTDCKGAPSISYFTNISSVDTWLTTKLDELSK